MYFLGQATKPFLWFSMLGQRVPTRSSCVFALLLEETGGWGGSAHCIPALQKVLLPGIFGCCLCPFLLIFSWPPPSPPLYTFFKKSLPVLWNTLKASLSLINSKQKAYFKKHKCSPSQKGFHSICQPPFMFNFQSTVIHTTPFSVIPYMSCLSFFLFFLLFLSFVLPFTGRGSIRTGAFVVYLNFISFKLESSASECSAFFLVKQHHLYIFAGVFIVSSLFLNCFTNVFCNQRQSLLQPC